MSQEIGAETFEMGTVGHLLAELQALVKGNESARDAIVCLDDQGTLAFSSVKRELWTCYADGTFATSKLPFTYDTQHFNAVVLASRPGLAGDILRQRFFGKTTDIAVTVGANHFVTMCHETALPRYVKEHAHLFGAGETLLCFRSTCDIMALYTTASLKKEHPLHASFIDSSEFIKMFTVSRFSNQAFTCKYTLSEMETHFFANPFARVEAAAKDATSCGYCKAHIPVLSHGQTQSACCRASIQFAKQ